jgi:protein disulfide-isomerase A1
MIKTTFLILLVFLYAQSEVVELTDESFKDFTTKNNYAFVYFYSPSCKYCLVLEPEFKKLSEEFNQTNVKFAKIDATSYESLS